MFPFAEVKNILIPVVPKIFQKKIEKKYLQMNEYHNQAIALREKGDESYESIMAKAKNMLYEILKKFYRGKKVNNGHKVRKFLHST